VSRLKILGFEQSPFFVRDGETLRNRVQLSVQNDGPCVAARVRVSAQGMHEEVPLGVLATGHSERDVYLPDRRTPGDVRVQLWAADALQCEQAVTWTPQRHWEVYLVQYAHHDLGYTDLPSNVLQAYDGFMDQVVAYCRETERWPDRDARFRYLCEQAWSVVHYVENRPPDVVDDLMRFVRNGQIEIAALFGNQTLELCGTEELVRLLYPAFRLRREYGIDVVSAEHNDIPGFVWGLASVLAGAGVRYFSPGVPLWYFGLEDERVHPPWDAQRALPLGRPAACWWEGPDGARVLLWSDLKGPDEWQPYDVEQAESELPGMLDHLDREHYPYDLVSYTLPGGHRDNAPPTLRYAYMVRAWNGRWAYPRLINATNRIFLEAFELKYGDALATLRGDLPGTDYPVAATCTPRETAVDRVTHDWLPIAEQLASQAAILAEYDYPRAALDMAYRETFYYDLHCWGMSDVGGPAQDAHWAEKAAHAFRAAALAHDVTVKAANKLADEISYPDDAYYITVFNTLDHEQSNVVRVPAHTWAPCGAQMFWRNPEADEEWPTYVTGRAVGRKIVNPPASLLEHPFEIEDVESGQRVPYQITTITDPQAAVPWAAERVARAEVEGGAGYAQEIVILGERLPAMGHRTYRVVECDHWPAFAESCTTGKLSLRNLFYDLAIDAETGAVVSLHDIELDRELVDATASHAFGQMIVRTAQGSELSPPALEAVEIVEDGLICTTLRIKLAAPCCPRVTEDITLYHGLKRIDLGFCVLRDSTPMRELYVAFPFQIENPRFRFEGPAAVVEPIRDQWPGSCTDSYAVQHWVDVSGGDWGVTWSALDTPMVGLGGLWPGYVSGAHHGVRGPEYGHPFLQSGELARGHIYALVSYNNFRTNFLNAHPGEFLVRYSLGTHRGGWRDGGARRFGWAVTHPPLAVWMKGPRAGGGLPSCASFCQVDAPNITVLTLKQAEDSDGYILRLMETEGREVEVSIALPYLPLRQVVETNLVEENRQPLPCTEHTTKVRMGPYALKTLRLRVVGKGGERRGP